jgi:hypothetical protein
MPKSNQNPSRSWALAFDEKTEHEIVTAVATISLRTSPSIGYGL